MSQIERTLEEERRIIEAATAGPWREFDDEGQSYLCPPSTGAYLIDYGVDRNQQTRDAVFIAHARTALPLRNAQVEMAWEIVELLEQSAATARAAGYGQEDATWARMQGMAFAYDDARTALRRAIEEAGA